MVSQELAKPAPKAPQKTPLKSFLSGGFGGICLVLVGHPFDLIKVRLQTSNQYKGIVDCASQIIKADGFRGLYRGMSSPLYGIVPIFAICFWGYDVGRRLALRLSGQPPNSTLTYPQILFAGGFSALPATLVMAPGERVKILLQIQGSSSAGSTQQYNGFLDVIKKLFKEGGIRSIYKGTFATLLRDVPASAAYFGTYEFVKKSLTPKGSTPDQLNPASILFAGGMAGVFNWLVAIPADVLKSKLQSAPEGKYNGLNDVLKDVLQKEGPKGLFKGLGPALLRAFPANAACFFGAELSLKIMNKFW